MWIFAAMLLAVPVEGISFQDEEEELEDAAPWRVHAYAGGGLWGGFWKFETDLPTRTATIRGDYATIADAGLSLGQESGIEFFGEYEFAQGRDFRTQMGIFGGGYTWKRFGEVLGAPFGQYWNLNVGVLGGMLDVRQSRFPGDFDPGFGIQSTLGYRILFSKHFGMHVQGGGRYMRFNYNPPGDVTASDSFLGGWSLMLTVGVDWRF